MTKDRITLNPARISGMTSRHFLKVCWFVALTCFLPAPLHAQANDAEKGKIEALIHNVESLKDAQFIRNGSTYNSTNAAKFLRGKWQSKDKEIHTVADFIEKAATFSSTTGKPYLIRFSDGREVKCGDYLKGILKP